MIQVCRVRLAGEQPVNPAEATAGADRASDHPRPHGTTRQRHIVVSR
ncbi:hypothetical protein WEI85_33165 [Actinomycetes bacterium KLBMP 9797]